ncbi:DNA-binding transcriptional regulator, HxlR family [Flexibacter flexilis DSM 6793]|uniref:DNA-binding transcriptional regulator, HxlR family n=1 Tax=Flexibacter flexilis DSM 6793 TaxID=927664 RepID=A0A1I1LUA6_9BACT|nr:helix-turn-helix domain-containing protein [Flexibacter flexilis]SFC76847.1 DNA-binding transcriptional regulator, HxlR family [Flexibacter flexilis DSM 6793]
MTNTTPPPQCPAETLLKLLSGKWKPQIFRMATQNALRFSVLLKTLEGANKQSIAVALKELEQADLLHKQIISQKPLHIEYRLSARGQQMIPVFEQLEKLLG